MVRARWVALFVVVGLAYLPRLDDVCGLFSDDAWYVLLARALATGEGYTLTNLPTPGVAPVYPPGFPLLLSLVFRMAPGFPGNVVLLKAVSIVSMAAVAVLTIRYCCRDQGFSFPTAWFVALATAVVVLAQAGRRRGTLLAVVLGAVVGELPGCRALWHLMMQAIALAAALPTPVSHFVLSLSGGRTPVSSPPHGVVPAQ